MRVTDYGGRQLLFHIRGSVLDLNCSVQQPSVRGGHGSSFLFNRLACFLSPGIAAVREMELDNEIEYFFI